MKAQNISTYFALFLIAASGFTSYPSLASGFYHLFIITPLAFILVLLGRLEGYREARDDYAPQQPIKGHKLYKFVEWMETPHFGVRGVWIALAALIVATAYSRWH